MNAKAEKYAIQFLEETGMLAEDSPYQFADWYLNHLIEEAEKANPYDLTVRAALNKMRKL